MTWLSAIIMGLVQGIAEFLPISSSGHLAIAEHLLNMQGASEIPRFYDVLLHLGTLVAVFIAYWDEIYDMIVEFFAGVGDLVHHTTPKVVPPARRMILLVIVGTLPLFVMVPFRRFFEGLSDNMYFIGGALLFTGVLLFVSDRVRRGGKTEKTARLADALVVGIGQALEQGGHSLTYYQGHNEQGMAHAAMAYAKQNRRRKIIACTSSIGPGALNMVTAAGTATANRIPLLLLPGDTFACRQPDPVLQQIEQTGCYETTANDAFRAVCKYWDRIARPEQLMTAAINAMRVLTDPAETGAVCLAMPQDVEGEAFDYPDYFLQKRVWYLDPVAREIEAAVKLIANAKRPLLIAGGGVTYSEAEDALLAFAERFSIPIGETQAGKGQLPWDHPLNLGGIGVTGGAAANALAKEADLVIAVGSRLTDFTTASKWGFQHPDVKLLGVNVCAFDALKMDAQTVIADAKETLSALLPALAETGYQAQWGGRIREVKDAFTAEVDRQYAVDLPEGLSQTRALGEINRAIAQDSIIVGSSGSLPGCLQRLWRPGAKHTYHLEYGFSCMGYEICGALGVGESMGIATPVGSTFLPSTGWATAAF